MRTPRVAFVASLFSILVLPVLVAIGTPEEEKPAPQEAELTIHAIRPNSWGFGDFSTDLQVLAPGDGPTEGSRLPSGDGETIAEAAIDETCAGPTYDAGLKDQTRWCLSISGLQPGHTHTGEIEGGGTTLTLTIGARYSYWGWPIALTSIGFLVAFAAALWPKTLRNMIKSSLLSREIAHTESAGADEVVGLRDWVAGRLIAGDTSEALLPVVASVVRDGPRNARDAREKLRTALDESPIDPGHPFHRRASEVADDPTLRAKDFLEPDEAKLKAELPADEWRSALESLVQRHSELQELAGEIERLVPGCKQEAAGALEQAEREFQTVFKSADFPRLEGQLNYLHNTIMPPLRAQPDCWIPLPRGAAAAPPASVGGRGRAIVPTPLGLVATWRSLIGAGFAFFATLVLVAAFAYVSVAFANYLSKPEFGTAADFWELFAAAVGATLAATVLSFVAYWDVNEPAPE